MSLSADGTLVPATGHPFTHILKPAGTGGFATLPIVEWLCQVLGRMAGLEVPDAALVEMPEGMPPALLVERIDIRRGPEDMRRFALEDFCSILDLPTSAKYDGTIERIAKGLRPLSTDPAADLDMLFRRAVFAWMVADGDMHLKNLALLKIAEPGAKTFTSVRFAPLCGAVTTRVFLGLATDRMALKPNGKDDRLTKADFLAMARTIGVAGGRAEAVLTVIATRLATGAATLNLPDMVAHSQISETVRGSVVAIVIKRSARFTD
jgi:serine/threonine-protein kinase HipA